MYKGCLCWCADGCELGALEVEIDTEIRLGTCGVDDLLESGSQNKVFVDPLMKAPKLAPERAVDVSREAGEPLQFGPDRVIGGQLGT